MRSEKQTLDEALAEFQMIRNCSPFRYSGLWYVVKTKDGFIAYRTRKAAENNLDVAICNEFWKITL